MCDSWHGIHGRRWWWWCFILWWRSRPSVWKSWSDVPCKLARALGTILYCRDWDNSEVWWTFSAIRFQPNLSSVCHAHGWLWIRCVARGFTSASNAKESRGIPCVKSSRARQKPHHLPQTKGRAQTRISFWTAVVVVPVAGVERVGAVVLVLMVDSLGFPRISPHSANPSPQVCESSSQNAWQIVLPLPDSPTQGPEPPNGHCDGRHMICAETGTIMRHPTRIPNVTTTCLAEECVVRWGWRGHLGHPLIIAKMRTLPEKVGTNQAGKEYVLFSVCLLKVLHFFWWDEENHEFSQRIRSGV